MSELFETGIAKGKGGRPPKFNDPAQFENMCDLYFLSCDEHLNDQNVKEPTIYTIGGLAIFLGMTREGLRDYSNKTEYADVVKRAKDKIIGRVESMLLTGKCSPAGAIFWLKNNGGYRDKHETELTGKDGGPISFEAILREIEAEDRQRGAIDAETVDQRAIDA